MVLRKFWLILILGISQFFSLGYGAYRGVVFGKSSFDFSLPFVFLSKYELLGDEEVSFGDYSYKQFSMPFFISGELAYLAIFSEKQKLLGFTKLRYSDDPINFLFDSELKNKLNATQFNSQNLNVFFLFKYFYKLNNNLDLSTSFNASFDFNRENRLENFNENFYNTQIYSLFLNLKLKELGDSFSALRRMVFNFELGYSYNYFPNSVIERDLIGLPNTKEDYHSLDFSFNYLVGIIPNLSLNTTYRFNLQSYTDKLVHTGSISGGYSDNNQKDILNNLELSLNMGFLDKGDYRLLQLSTSYSIGFFYSTHVELIEIGEAFLGKYPLPSSAVFVNNSYAFYQKDFKNYLSNVLGLYLSININLNNSIQMGYSFALKQFMNSYARLGDGLNPAVSTRDVITSGRVNEKTAINTYGIYSDEKRKDIFNTYSLGYLWKSSKKDRSVSPYIGIQRSDSNDFSKKQNRYIFIFGTRVSYEF